MPDSPAKPIPETVTYLLANTCKSNRNMADKFLAEIGLRRGQEMILCRLWENDGMMQSELAEQICVKAATVTKMLNRMVQAGWVERRSDTQDQRVSRVYLTKQGRNLRPAVEQVWQKLDQYVTRSLSPEDRLLFKRLLIQMLDNFNCSG